MTTDRIDTTIADWFVYIVECSDGSLYTGIARDVDARVATHNLGKGARYTRSRQPVTLTYAESASDRATALRREIEIKSLARSDKLSLIASQPL